MEIPRGVDAAAGPALTVTAPDPLIEERGIPEVTPPPPAVAEVPPKSSRPAAVSVRGPDRSVAPSPPRAERSQSKFSTLPPAPPTDEPAPWDMKATGDSKGRHAVEAELSRQLEQARLATRIDDPSEYRLQEARQLIAACERELGRNDARARTEPHRVARLHYEIARQFEYPLGELSHSAEHYKKAHSAWPEYVPALRGARRVLTRQGQYAALLPLFDAEVRLAADPKGKARLYHEKGRLLEDQLAQPRPAREAFRVAVAHDPANPVIVSALEAAERAAGAWPERDAAVEKLANVVTLDARHRAALIAARARSAEVHQKDELAAIELYHGALALDPHATGALPALKRLLYTHKRWGELVSALELEANLVSDIEVRALALYRAGRLQHDRLGQLSEAIVSLEKAVQNAPNDATILDELGRLYAEAQRYDSLVLVLERLVALSPDARGRAGMLHQIGRLHEDQLGDVDSAIRWYSAELEIDPASLPALQSLSRLYREREQWVSLIGIHTAEANGASDPARRAAAYANVAELFEQRLNDSEQAAAHHAHALGVVPGYPPSFKALTRLYAQAGNHRGLVELLERAVDLAEDGETRIMYLFKIGRIYEDALAAPAQALTAYRRILDVDGKHLAAMHAMQRSSERASLYRELVEALELEAHCTIDRKRVVALYHRAGEVLEQQLADIDGAIQRYRRVVELDSHYQPALISLGRAYDAAGLWQELIDVYERQLALEPKGLPAAALWYKIGEIYELRLGRDEKALEAYRKAVDVEPGHIPSVQALDRRLAASGHWLELIRLLERSAEHSQDEGARARGLYRAGELYEHRLSKLDKAMACYDRAIEVVSAFRPALDGRARLLAQNAEWQKLVECLGQEAAHSGDPLLVVAAQIRQGELLRDELSRPENAVACFEAVLAKLPDHVGALLAIEPLYAASAQWEKLARVLTAKARVLQDGSARVAALKELARIQKIYDAGNTAALQHTYSAVLQLAPGDVDALHGLELLALEAADAHLLGQVDAQLSDSEDASVAAAHRTRLAEALEAVGDESALRLFREAVRLDPDDVAATRGITRLARRNADADQLEAAAEGEARIGHDVDLAGTLLVEASALQIKAGNGEGALRALRRALEIAPEHDLAARSLRELMLMAGRIQELVDSLTHAAQSAQSKERSGVLWGQVADLQAEKLKDLPAAVATLHRVAKLMPSHQPTLMKLADLYAADSQWAPAVEVLRRALPVASKAQDQAAAQLRLAIILHERLNDPKAARDALNAVLTVEPANAQALERLLNIQITDRLYDAASKTAQRLIEAAPDAGVKARALGHRAELERRLGRKDEALGCYQEAVAMVGVGPVAQRFRALVEHQKSGETGNWAGYAQALVTYVENAPGGEQAAATCLELGSVMNHQLEQPEQAIVALKRGLSIEPANVQILGELASAFSRAGRMGEAVEALRGVVALDTQRSAAWREMSAAFAAMHRQAEAAAALAPLVTLGAATDTERALVVARPPRPAASAPGSVDEELVVSLRPQADAETATALLASFHDGLPKLYGTELERYGVSARDRLVARSGHPLRNVVDRVAAIFGLAEVDLYVHRAHQGSASVEFTDTPAILVPEAVGAHPDAYQVFVVSRVIANMARRIQAVDRLPAQTLDLLLTSAARNANGSFGAGKGDEDYLNSQAKKISKSLAWGRRRPLEEAAEAYALRPVQNIPSWILNERLTAARAALLVCDDLTMAVEALRRTEGDLAGVQGEALARTSLMIEDLMRFWVSEVAFAARRRLGTL